MIAIENARLFNETQEALERQTATSDVLRVISQSVSDVAPVFEAILDSCRRLLGLEMVAIYLVDGDRVKGAAQRGWTGGDGGATISRSKAARPGLRSPSAARCIFRTSPTGPTSPSITGKR